MLHELKTEPIFFEAIIRGYKRFEIRKDDRSPRFALDDHLRLREYIPEGLLENSEPFYTGRECFVRVTYRTDFQQQPGYIVLGLSDPI